MTDTTQIPAETLAACPFCGAAAELEHGSDHHGAWFNLGCSRHWGSGLVDADDGCIGGRIFYTETETPEAEAIAAWNTRAALTRRAGSDAIPAGDVEALAQFLHDEGGFGEAMTDRTWPEHDGDTGQREGGWVKTVPPDVLAHFRDVARRWLLPRIAATPKPPAGGGANEFGQ